MCVLGKIRREGTGRGRFSPHDPDAEDKKARHQLPGPSFSADALLALEGALAGASHPVLARQACALRVAYSHLVRMFDQLGEAPAEGCGTKNYEEYLQRHRLSGFVLPAPPGCPCQTWPHPVHEGLLEY